MKKILVLVADYPDNNGKVTLMYVHTRNLAYIKNNIDVTVLNFNTLVNYEIEGVKVISLDYYKKNNNEYDFVTIRANFDNSKYAIDIVNRLACNTPNAKFLLIGKGDFFKYYKKASNIIWLDKNLSHNEIIDILQKCRFSLMPTRTDAQGLMMCEMAAFGIPVITSDIPVCHEIFDDFDNVTYINNLDEKLNLNKYLNAKNVSLKDERYFLKETILKKLSILNKDN